MLAGLPGLGRWTVEMVAMRGLGDPDAFPPGDLGLRRAAGSRPASVEPGGPCRTRRAVAPLAGLCDPASLGDRRPPGQPVAPRTAGRPTRTRIGKDLCTISIQERSTTSMTTMETPTTPPPQPRRS